MALETLDNIVEVGGFEIAHLDEAISKEEYLNLIKDKFIIHGRENNTIAFKIQNGPIMENGLNGCQVQTMIEVSLLILSKLNNKFPCKENQETIDHLKAAIEAQVKRTTDRFEREVEGTNQA